MNPEILLIFTVGTSASGKSSWAQSMRAQYPKLRIAILERDQLRQEMLHKETGQVFSWASWNAKWEPAIQERWQEAVRENLDGDALIIADTHIDPQQLVKEATFAKDLGIREMVIQYFSVQPLVELIRRDQDRPYPVGAAILREQIQRLRPEEEYWMALESVLLETTSGTNQKVLLS